MNRILNSPRRRNDAAIAPAELAEDVRGYSELAPKLVELAPEQPGFLGIESGWQGGFALAVSYRASLEAIDAEGRDWLVQKRTDAHREGRAGLLRLSDRAALARHPARGGDDVIRVSAFRWVPQFARGQVRDLRVRWALEEAGLAYQERLIGFEDQATPEYRELQPFGQVPAYEEDGLVLFESGAIVLHVAQRCDALLPRDPAGRARATAWVFAALNTIEPALQQLASLDFFHAGEAWAAQRRPDVVAFAKRRLGELADWLDGDHYLEKGFTAGDLMMSTVLRIVGHTDLLSEFPALDAYQRRCEARPQFQKALAAQLVHFDAGA